MIIKIVIAILLSVSMVQADMPVCKKKYFQDMMTLPNLDNRNECSQSAKIVSPLFLQMKSALIMIPDNREYFMSLSDTELIETKRIMNLMRGKIRWVLDNINIKKCIKEITKWIDRVAAAAEVLAFGMAVLSAGLAIAGIFLTPFYGAGIAVSIVSILAGLASAGIGVGVHFGSEFLKHKVANYYSKAQGMVSTLAFYSEYMRVMEENIDLKIMSKSTDPLMYSFPSSVLYRETMKYHLIGDSDMNSYNTRINHAIYDNLDLEKSKEIFQINHNMKCNSKGLSLFTKLPNSEISMPTAVTYASKMLEIENPKCCIVSNEDDINRTPEATLQKMKKKTLDDKGKVIGYEQVD